jgi:ribosome assembly protein YihI (activator of Der GTPase)
MELLTMESKRTNWNDDRLDELSRRVDEGFREMREGFARVDEKFDRVSERIDKLIFTMWAAGGAVGATAIVSLVKLAFF